MVDPDGPVNYFAYGPELQADYMAELCAGATKIGAARIPHHTVGFTGRSAKWGGGGTATISLAPGRDLWGGLYRIDPGCRPELEAWGRPDGYVWCWTRVLSEPGQGIPSGLLAKVRDLEATTPAPEYLRRLQEGWREWGLEGVPGSADDRTVNP